MIAVHCDCQRRTAATRVSMRPNLYAKWVQVGEKDEEKGRHPFASLISTSAPIPHRAVSAATQPCRAALQVRATVRARWVEVKLGKDVATCAVHRGGSTVVGHCMRHEGGQHHHDLTVAHTCTPVRLIQDCSSTAWVTRASSMQGCASVIVDRAWVSPVLQQEHAQAHVSCRITPSSHPKGQHEEPTVPAKRQEGHLSQPRDAAAAPCCRRSRWIQPRASTTRQG